MPLPHWATIAISSLFIAFGLLGALETFLRLSISQSDTKGLQWLLPLARWRWRSDDSDHPEKDWMSSAFNAAAFTFVGVIFLVRSL